MSLEDDLQRELEEPIEEGEPLEEPVDAAGELEKPVESEVSEEPEGREAALLARIEELQAQLLEKEAVPAPVEVPKEPSAPQEPNFLEGVSIDEMLEDPAILNKVLVSVYSKGRDDAAQHAAEQVLQSLPRVVTTYIGQHTTMKSMVDDFFKENPDLLPVRRTVAAVANEINANEPGLSTKELFMKSAAKTREVLKIKRQVGTKGEKKVVSKPAFAKQASRLPLEQGLEGVAAEIEDLVDL